MPSRRRGIGRYAAHHKIDALIGCASLAGTHADEFGTTDLFTVLLLASADPRYFARFGTSA